MNHDNGVRYRAFVTTSALENATALLAGAQRVVVLTGAGISTASGIPDFRGPEGVWTKDPDAEMLSTYETWLTRPDVRQRAWASRVARRTNVASPNDGHRALVTLASRGVLDLLVTQNIDGLHQKAGFDASRIVEIHGSALHSVCLRCADRLPIEQTLDRVNAGESDPTCLAEVQGETCRGLLKSATISFGQSLVAKDLRRSELAAQQCDLLLAVGSTLSVYPVAALVPLAKSHGARVVIVNGEPTALDDLADVLVSGDITRVLPEMVSI